MLAISFHTVIDRLNDRLTEWQNAGLCEILYSKRFIEHNIIPRKEQCFNQNFNLSRKAYRTISWINFSIFINFYNCKILYTKDVGWNMIPFRKKRNALFKIYISAEKYITCSNDSTNKLQHLSVTIRSSVISCHNQYINGKKYNVLNKSVCFSQRIRENVALERFYLHILSLAALPKHN